MSLAYSLCRLLLPILHELDTSKASMPSLPSYLNLRAGGASSPFNSDGQSDASDYDSSRVWVTAVAVVCTLTFAMLGIGLAFFYYRRRQHRKAQARDPYLTLKEFSRRSEISVVDRTNEEEMRRIMIRKSLASRSSKTLSQIDAPGFGRVEVDEDDEEEEQRASTLREDWKEWEERMRMERTRSGEQHPLQSMTDLTIPSKSQDRSPSRSPLLKHQRPVTPLPPTPQLE